MDEPLDLSVLLLTKNEAANLQILVPRLKHILDESSLKYEVIVVDAGSRDGTEQLCVESGVRFALQTKPGFGAALGQGFRLCKGRRVLTMDADLQHDPAMIPRLLRTDADLVIGSRWVGRVGVNLSIVRRVLSLTLNGIFSKCLGLRIKDTSSNFRVYERRMVENLEIEARDFDAMQDVLAKCITRGCTVVELPISFAERHAGHSNASLPRFLLSYARTLVKVVRMRILYLH